MRGGEWPALGGLLDGLADWIVGIVTGLAGTQARCLGLVAAGRDVVGVTSASARSLIVRSAWRYGCVERTSACPSQSAITVVSTPACSSDIAQLWRSTCGCSRLPASDGQLPVAVLVWMASRRSIASRLSRLPVRVGKSGSCGRPARSLIHEESTVCAGAVSGTARCFLPLPSQRTCAPVPSTTSAQVSPISSETRSPAWIARVSIARSRRPSQRVWSGASIRILASSAVRNVTVRFSYRLGGIESTRAISSACSGCRAPRT